MIILLKQFLSMLNFNMVIRYRQVDFLFMFSDKIFYNYSNTVSALISTALRSAQHRSQSSTSDNRDECIYVQSTVNSVK